MIFSVAIGVLILSILCCCGCICRRCRQSRGNDKVIILADETEMNFNNPNSVPNQSSTINLHDSDILKTEENENSKVSLRGR